MNLMTMEKGEQKLMKLQGNDMRIMYMVVKHESYSEDRKHRGMI
jgi:hypothetical protein